MYKAIQGEMPAYSKLFILMLVVKNWLGNKNYSAPQ